MAQPWTPVSSGCFPWFRAVPLGTSVPKARLPGQPRGRHFRECWGPWLAVDQLCAGQLNAPDEPDRTVSHGLIHDSVRGVDFDPLALNQG